MIPTATTTKSKRSRLFIAESDLRDGGTSSQTVLPVGSPEAAAAIARVAAMLADPKGRQQRQKTPLVGRALTGEPSPKPVKVSRPRSDPAITARARELRAAGTTWPEIGRMLGENANNLRIRCQRGEKKSA